MKKLIVGLGNPGLEHAKNRHNTGFIIVDELVDGWKFNSKFNAELAENGDVIYAKPQTMMNKSGEAVQRVAAFFKIPAEKICLIHDDADILPGEYKFQKGRAAAGHKGVQSVIDMLDTDEFWRVRVGFLRPENPEIDLEDWVLGNYNEQEIENIKNLVPKIREEIENI